MDVLTAGGVGFYFRNVTKLVLFGFRGHMRTLQPGCTQVNIISSQKREHSRKPNQIYDVIENCSPGPYLELFARFRRKGWDQWGNEDVEENSSNGVAQRKGQIATPMRLFERSVQYGANKTSKKFPAKKRKLV
ncbi:S-adenosylmethionine-binding protein [Candidatus Brocadia pituitae]|nr:S-adenosylmethionine-binding protein [Candidatus Brocadia pituitae]